MRDMRRLFKPHQLMCRKDTVAAGIGGANTVKTTQMEVSKKVLKKIVPLLIPTILCNWISYTSYIPAVVFYQFPSPF